MGQRLSIAMCTYNGGKYIREQLRSFAEQTRRPDELIVCDDASVDDTRDIVRDFASGAPFEVVLVANERTLGFARNFEKCASMITGDIVFFSDQDDVWRPEKLRLMSGMFDADPHVGLVFCDAELVDRELRPLGRQYWAQQGFSPAQQDRLEGPGGARLLLRNPSQMAAGATMAYATRFAADIFPVPPGWTHDAWIATIVAARSRVALVRQPLNLYRQHSEQVYGASATLQRQCRMARSRSASTRHFDNTAARYQFLAERLQQAKTLAPDLSGDIARKVAHWRARSAMRSKGRLGRLTSVAHELLLGRYARYSQGLRSAAMDCLY